MDYRAESPVPGIKTVTTIGNPNTGKSTLFNTLTGLKQQVSNFPGVTVEYAKGLLTLEEFDVQLIDVPGTYSLTAQSPDEIVAVDILQGAVPEVSLPDAVIIVIDSTNLRRNLFLCTQVLEAGVPAVLALNMKDSLPALGIEIDYLNLEQILGVPLIPVSASTGEGIANLKTALLNCLRKPLPPRNLEICPDIDKALAKLLSSIGEVHVSAIEARRAFIDKDGIADDRLSRRLGQPYSLLRDQLRSELGKGRSISAIEARDRYSWINTALKKVQSIQNPNKSKITDVLDRALNHPFIGSIIFILTMGAVFQAVFAWAAPLVELINLGVASLSQGSSDYLGDGLISSFISNGLIAGVGSVIVFLPQILILFTFIILLEDSGYISRAAFLMDRVMRRMGLSGQAFIPMLSSFACAVPGIMGTRIMADRHDRLATILAAPFMTCSARLPIYSLLIGTFIPNTHVFGGFIYLQGLILLSLYLLGILGGGLTAFIVSCLFWKRKKSTFLLEMPPYRLPKLSNVAIKLYGRAMVFLKRAGTIIFSVTLLIWLLASFPTPNEEKNVIEPSISQSYLGQMSRTVAPLFTPLGWDWKITAAVIASFPAREVVIAALATIYAVDLASDGEATPLSEKIRNARHDNGTKIYTIPMVLGLLVFYALCLQCISTVAVIRKETDSWRWPIISWIYMTSLGYGGAFLVYQVGSAIA
jgi:ferrous iron transport protein B